MQWQCSITNDMHGPRYTGAINYAARRGVYTRRVCTLRRRRREACAGEIDVFIVSVTPAINELSRAVRSGIELSPTRAVDRPASKSMEFVITASRLG